jgi:hypothetical protein
MSTDSPATPAEVPAEESQRTRKRVWELEKRAKDFAAQMDVYLQKHTELAMAHNSTCEHHNKNFQLADANVKDLSSALVVLYKRVVALEDLAYGPPPSADEQFPTPEERAAARKTHNGDAETAAEKEE